MDYFLWHPSLEKVTNLDIQSEYWQKPKEKIKASFLLSDTDKDSLLEFFTNHIEEDFIYFTQKREEQTKKPTVYAYSTDVILVDDTDENFRCQLWLSDNVDEYSVDSGQDSYTINYDIPAEGTIRFALEYTGDGDYVQVDWADGAFLQIYIEDDILIGVYKEENKTCFVEIPIGNIWQFNLVMGQVISFSLSWNDLDKVALAHNNQIKEFYFARSFYNSQITTLASSYDIILFDVSLFHLIKKFDYKFEDFTAITVNDYDLIVNDYNYFVKSRLGFPARFDTTYISFRESGTQFLTENVLIQEI